MKALIVRKKSLSDTLFVEPVVRAIYAAGYNEIYIKTNNWSVFDNHPLVKVADKLVGGPHQTFKLDGVGRHRDKKLLQKLYLEHCQLTLPEHEMMPRLYLSQEEKKYGYTILAPTEKWAVIDTGHPKGKAYQYWSEKEWRPILENIKEKEYNLVFVGRSGQNIGAIDSDDLDLRNITGVRQLMGIIEAADIFVGVESGPMHIANALGKKGIGLFGLIDPNSRLPQNSTIKPVQVRSQLASDKLLNALEEYSDPIQMLSTRVPDGRVKRFLF